MASAPTRCAAAFDIEQKTAWNVIARRSYKDVA